VSIEPVKRSRAIQLVLLASTAAVEGCGRRQCVDERDIVVEDRYCQQPYLATGHGYRFYNGGFFGSSPVGSSLRSSGTVRGVFGGAGEAAHGGGGGE
jgi:hypothetical protein